MGYDFSSYIPGAQDVSKIQQNVLAGAKNAQAIVDRAKALIAANKSISGDKVKSEAFKFFYSQAAVALQSLSEQPLAKTIGLVAETGYEIVTRAQDIANTVAKGDVDASGVADISGQSAAIVSSLTKSLLSLGAIDLNTAKEINDWTELASGCAAGIAAEPYSGAAACALSFISKVWKVLSGADDKPPGKRAIFVPDQKTNQFALAATDAQRLAAVLRYHWGFPSYAERLYQIAKYHHWLDKEGGYGKPHAKGDPPTAVDMRCILAMMAGPGVGGYDAWNGTDKALYAIHDDINDGGRGLYDRDVDETLLYDHDVPIYAVQRLAFNARALIKSHGFPMSVASLQSTTTDSFWPGADTGNLWAGICTEDLVRFFAGMTYWQMKYERPNTLDWYLKYPLPVRLFAVCDQGEDCRVDWPDEDSGHKPWGQYCWTSLDRCGMGTGRCNELEGRVRKADACAIDNFAVIRLMAAFSYMHQAYVWGGHDMIKALPSVSSSDPAAMLVTPVNPRQVKVGRDANGRLEVTGYRNPWPTPVTLMGQVQARQSLLSPVIRAAKQAAQADNTTQVLKIGSGYGEQLTKQSVAQTIEMSKELIKTGELQFKSVWDESSGTATATTKKESGGAGLALLAIPILLTLMK